MARDPRSDDFKERLRKEREGPEMPEDPEAEEGVLEAIQKVQEELGDDTTMEEAYAVMGLIYLQDITLAQIRQTEAIEAQTQLMKRQTEAMERIAREDD